MLSLRFFSSSPLAMASWRRVLPHTQQNLRCIASAAVTRTDRNDNNHNAFVNRFGDGREGQQHLSMSFDEDERVFCRNEEVTRSHRAITTPPRRIGVLPRTMHESDRAVVVTEKTPPFRIVYVNQAWEGLCGYRLEECRGERLSSLLQGPDTDQSSVTLLIHRLLQQEEVGTVLTNYTKQGRRFRNRLRLGPLNHEHFVGVLQEIDDGK